jgi:hypothetical protein
MISRNKGAIAALVLSVLLFPVASLAGSLDSPGAPAGGSAMPTLQGIYNQLATGATSSPAGSFQEPAAGPTAGTGKSLTEIKAKLPLPDNTSGATVNDVLSGKTFWGLRTNGTWGHKTGALSSGSDVSGGDGLLAFPIPDGYYSEKTATANDADLVSGNIKSGVNIFGVNGSVIESSGNAAAGDVLTGKTFSNTGGAGIAGSMPNRGTANFTPGASAVPVPSGYYSGGQVNGDSKLSSCNIRPGQTIFGVTGKPYPAATGQTGCWNASGAIISCAGSGQDGAYQYGCNPAVAPSGGSTGGGYNRTSLGWSSAAGSGFVDKGDETVTDMVTGLIWTKAGDCFGTETWSDALTACNGLADGACGLSDGSAAGAWRLANLNELRSLIDPSQSNPCLPAGHPFTNQLAFYYWSSTTSADDTSGAWIVSMWNGYVGYDYKDGSLYVRCVRGGQ